MLVLLTGNDGTNGASHGSRSKQEKEHVRGLPASASGVSFVEGEGNTPGVEWIGSRQGCSSAVKAACGNAARPVRRGHDYPQWSWSRSSPDAPSPAAGREESAQGLDESVGESRPAEPGASSYRVSARYDSSIADFVYEASSSNLSGGGG